MKDEKSINDINRTFFCMRIRIFLFYKIKYIVNEHFEEGYFFLIEVQRSLIPTGLRRSCPAPDGYLSKNKENRVLQNG